jgi:hypothetical protein
MLNHVEIEKLMNEKIVYHVQKTLKIYVSMMEKNVVIEKMMDEKAV